MDNVINIYKPQSVTPFQLIKRLVDTDPQLKNRKISYAGRLDPLAHGVMLLLVGDENKNRNEYLNSDKTYEFSCLFGISTDTYDLLGICKNSFVKTPPRDLKKKILNYIKSNTGEITQSYPPYSSKTIGGIPLFKLAKQNKLNDIILPKRKIRINKFELIEMEIISSQSLKKIVSKNLRPIKGFFRQTKIKQIWTSFFSANKMGKFHVANFRIDCTSGTYVRSVCHEMGEQFGCDAIALEILRTRVGRYKLKDSKII